MNSPFSKFFLENAHKTLSIVNLAMNKVVRPVTERSRLLYFKLF